MKRDMELCRSLLFCVEQLDSPIGSEQLAELEQIKAISAMNGDHPLMPVICCDQIEA